MAVDAAQVYWPCAESQRCRGILVLWNWSAATSSAFDDPDQRLCRTHDRQPSPGASGSCHHPQRTTSQATSIVMSGLLSSVANAPVFGPGCTRWSSGTISRPWPGRRSSSRSRAPPLLSAKGRMNFREGQAIPNVWRISSSGRSGLRTAGDFT